MGGSVAQKSSPANKSSRASSSLLPPAARHGESRKLPLELSPVLLVAIVVGADVSPAILCEDDDDESSSLLLLCIVVLRLLQIRVEMMKVMTRVTGRQSSVPSGVDLPEVALGNITIKTRGRITIGLSRNDK